MKSLRDAGAVIIAKTGMTELANWMAGPPTPMPPGYNPISGFGMNPYDPRRDPREGGFDGRPVLLPGLLVLASTAALGAWTEGRRWALPFDLARQLAIVVWFGWFAWSHAGAVASATAVGALAFAFLSIFVTTRPWRAWAMA